MTTEQRLFARKLRARATEAEDILWSLIRDRRLDGLKFRRQVPLLGYTVDFLCIERRLIIELDGHQHGWEADYDAERTAEIERHGFTVWPAAGFVDTEIGCFMKPEVGYAAKTVWA